MSPFGTVASGDSTDRKKAARDQDRGDGDGASHEPFHDIGEIGLVHVAQRHKRQDEPDASMRVSGAS